MPPDASQPQLARLINSATQVAQLAVSRAIRCRHKLFAKFFHYSDQISAAWIWSRIRRLGCRAASSRKPSAF